MLKYSHDFKLRATHSSMQKLSRDFRVKLLEESDRGGHAGKLYVLTGIELKWKFKA